MTRTPDVRRGPRSAPDLARNRGYERRSGSLRASDAGREQAREDAIGEAVFDRDVAGPMLRYPYPRPSWPGPGALGSQSPS